MSEINNIADQKAVNFEDVVWLPDPKKVIPICEFLEHFYTLPTGKQVRLLPHQKAFLRRAFALDDKGRLKYKQIIFSAPKKCKALDDLVLLADGTYVTIGSLINQNTTIIGFSKDDGSIAETKAIGSDNGNDYVVTFKCIGGMKFTETISTPVFTDKGWKLAKDVTLSDMVAMPIKTPEPASTVEIDDNELIFVAGMITEGCTLDYKCIFTNKEGPYLNRFLLACDKLGFPYKHFRPHSYSISTARLLLRRFDILNQRSEHKQIPNQIFRLSNKKIAIFLNFLFGGDGCYNNKGRIQYSSLSHDLCEKIILLLRRFGIYATLLEENCAGRQVNKTYKVEIASSSDVTKFIQEIGIFGKEPTFNRSNQKRASGTKLLPNNVGLEVIRTLISRKIKFYNTSLNNWRALNCFDRSVCEELLLNNGGIPQHLKEFFNPNIYWAPIKEISISDKPIPTASIEVPGYGAYLGINISSNSGKSSIAAMIMTWLAFSGMIERNGELYLLGNDQDQAAKTSYSPLRKAIEQNKFLYSLTERCNDSLIELKNGTIIRPLANDFAGNAGLNPDASVMDEPAFAISENARRLYDEMVPPPSKPNSLRIMTGYAGFVGISLLYEEIYNKIVKPEYLIDLGYYKNTVTGEETQLPVYENKETLCYWDHEPRMPTQTAEYYEAQRNDPGFREVGFKRIHLNMWVEAESGLDMSHWDQCVDQAIELNYKEAPGPQRDLPIAVGIDASIVKDRTSVVSTFKKDGQIYLGPRRYWQPNKDMPLNFENTIEEYLLELQKNYFITMVFYDPWQMESTAQRLIARGLPMVPWPQTQPNTILITEFLIDKLRQQGIVLYPDQELRREATMVTVKEIPGRGRRFVKDSKQKKIDSIIALAMSAFACERHCPDFKALGDQIMVIKMRKNRD